MSLKEYNQGNSDKFVPEKQSRVKRAQPGT